MAILLRRFDLALDNWWMYNSAFSERTPFGRAGQGLQEVVVDVLHCLVVGTPQPMEGGVSKPRPGQLQNIM